MNTIKTLIKLILLLLCLILLIYVLQKDNQTHYCIDSSHRICDGACECDGMECK